MKRRLAIILMMLGLGLSFTAFGSRSIAALRRIALTSFAQTPVRSDDSGSQIPATSLSKEGDENVFQTEATTATNSLAPTLVVTTTADTYGDSVCDADCSLREAIDAADNDGVPDVIGFSIPPSDPNCAGGVCEIKLTLGEFIMGSDGGNLMTIDGSGATKIVLDGQNAARHFFVGSGVNLAMNDLTLRRGNGQSSYGINSGIGGAILVQATFGNATLNLNNVTLRDNTSPGEGGAINCNTACALTITNSTVSNNVASDDGGGIALTTTQPATMTNVTISGNQAGGVSGTGGGILCSGCTLTGRHLTVTGNSAVSSGGGLKQLFSGTFNLRNSIVAGNSNATSPDVSGTFASNGYNFIGKNDGSNFVAGNPNPDNSIVGTIASPQNPLLLPLGDNGGPTRTHALAVNSPAVDKGNSITTTTDQRGAARPFDLPSIPNAGGGDGADIGAFEAQTQTQTLTVNKTADTNNGSCDSAGCSLREAVAAAAPGDTINLVIPASDPNCSAGVCTITLTAGQIVIDKNLTIRGPGANQLTVSGNNASRVFYIAPGSTVTLDALTISNGQVSSEWGAGIYNDRATLTVSNSIVSSNTASGTNALGGGIASFGTATLNVNNSTVSGNSAPGGGGIYNINGSTAIITNSTISGNDSTTGGGIYNFAGVGIATVNITSTTIHGNSANTSPNAFGGGGIFNTARGGTATLNLTNSTVSGNISSTAGGGIRNSSDSSPNNAPVTLNSSIVSDNSALVLGPDILTSGGTISGSYNLIETTEGYTFSSGSNNIFGVDPQLGALQNNGGFTQTRALQCGSPAIDKGKNANALATDQRGSGFARTFDDANVPNAADGDGTDIGAFEAQTTCNTPPTANSDSYSTNEDAALDAPAPGVLGNDTGGENNALTAVLVTPPTNGAVILNADGSFSYTPNANFFGSDSFTYKANDGQADSNVAAVAITVNSVNDNPDAVNDSATVAEDSSATAINVLGNDTAFPDTGETLSIAFATPAANGTLGFTNGSISYKPNPNFFGADSFTYTISDGNGGSDTATVSVTVTPVNDAPTITAASALSRQQGAAGSISTIAAVADVDNAAGSLTITTTSVPTGITVTGITNTNGTVIAAVSAACNAAIGANTVGLKVTDGGNLTATASLTINVTASTPPVITLKPFASMFPPNHSYRTFTVAQMVQSATDGCDGNVLSSVVIEKVTSDEADNAPGDSDGNTTNDIVIGANCKSVQLRAERDGNRNGRVYVVTLRVTDSSGNTVRAEYKVSVPLSQNGNPAIENAPVLMVNGGCP